MDWTTEKKGNAVNETMTDEQDLSYFEAQKKKMLAQFKKRLTRDRTHLLCSITGEPKVGKSGTAMDCRTDEEIEKGMKVLILDYDEGCEPTWDSAWNRDENIIIYNPNEMNDDGSTDWNATLDNGLNFMRYAKELIAEGNVKAFILDGLDKVYEGSSDVLREHLVKQGQREGYVIHDTDSVKVQTLDWKIRNRVYNRQLDTFCSLECDRFCITHMKRIYGDNINIPIPVGKEPHWHYQTPARFNQMIHIVKDETAKTGAKYNATLQASKTNPNLVGTEWIVFQEFKDKDNKWYGIPELREGTL